MYDAAIDGTPTPRAEPVTRHNLLDAVTARILRHIQEAGLRSGDRLPSTRALAERFLVATPTLREALRRLEATGAVEMRHGSGVYVRADLSRLILVNPNRTELAAETLADLLEARELIEPHLAEAATRNASDEQLAVIAAALDRAGHVLDDDAELHVANMDFHRAISRYAGNAVLAQIIDSLVDIYRQEQRAILEMYGDRANDHRAHLDILTAMRERKPVKARRLMAAHLRDVRAVVTGSSAG